MKENVKVGFCVAYDWYLLEYSLPLVYDRADKICLSLDRDRISWSGNRYNFDDLSFRKLIQQIDRFKKIEILEEDYHLKNLTPMQNEVRQRNRMGEFLGSGGWHIQLDCDEYFVDFLEFVKYLLRLPDWKTKKTNICCAWVVLYKRTENGFLYVNPERKENLYFIQIATRNPSYEYGRRNGDFNLCSPFFLVHQSWARSGAEIKEKVENWGHSDDFDSESYFKKWDSLDEFNYLSMKNFHPITPSLFPSLAFEKGKTVPELLKNLNYSNMISLSPTELIVRNSKWISRLKKLIKMIQNLFSPIRKQTHEESD